MSAAMRSYDPFIAVPMWRRWLAGLSGLAVLWGILYLALREAAARFPLVPEISSPMMWGVYAFVSMLVYFVGWSRAREFSPTRMRPRDWLIGAFLSLLLGALLVAFDLAVAMLFYPQAPLFETAFTWAGRSALTYPLLGPACAVTCLATAVRAWVMGR